MKLMKRPERPRWTPLVNLMFSSVRYKEWRPFLSVVDASYWNVELASNERARSERPWNPSPTTRTLRVRA